MRIDASQLELKEKMISVKRVAKVVKGGKRFHFSALMCVGDGKGHVGVALGKAGEVPDAIQKAIEKAKRRLIRVPLRGTTIASPMVGRFGASRVVFRPAAPGTGLIAGGGVRIVLELAGVRDILAKCVGNTNAHNSVRATFDAFDKLNVWAQSRRLRRQATGAPAAAAPVAATAASATPAVPAVGPSAVEPAKP
jgi:small subunit ribosomal protein S5